MRKEDPAACVYSQLGTKGTRLLTLALDSRHARGALTAMVVDQVVGVGAVARFAPTARVWVGELLVLDR
mgnify:CR=1 FL=1